MTDDIKKARLRRHKAIATGLFFLMAAVYGLMVYLQHNTPAEWMGYVKAFSEAAMVGALADWFAVTALFKHPLGIPIPHTNLIERKKDDLGDNLGHFVKDNFLNPKSIRPYIEDLDVIKWLSDWLSKPESQGILETEIVNLTKRIIRDLDDEDVEKFLSDKGSELLKTVNYPQITSSGIKYLIDNNEHIRILENLIPKAEEYVVESQDMIREKISENRPFIAFLAGKKISRELTDGLIAFLEEIKIDKNHFIRRKLTESLNNFAENIESSKEWEDKFEKLKNELITSENLQPYTADTWASVKEMLIESLENPDSPLKNYINKNILKLSETLMHDEELGTRLNKWIRLFLFRMILRNRDEAERLISSTVAGWEGRKLSEKLELEVGKDLQFIRINGTLVGGLVGLVIYIVTHLFIS